MSDLTDRLRKMDTWDEPLVTAMLDVIDAAESERDARAPEVACCDQHEPWDDTWVRLDDALARFREVSR